MTIRTRHGHWGVGGTAIALGGPSTSSCVRAAGSPRPPLRAVLFAVFLMRGPCEAQPTGPAPAPAPSEDPCGAAAAAFAACRGDDYPACPNCLAAYLPESGQIGSCAESELHTCYATEACPECGTCQAQLTALANCLNEGMCHPITCFVPAPAAPAASSPSGSGAPAASPPPLSSSSGSAACQDTAQAFAACAPPLRRGEASRPASGASPTTFPPPSAPAPKWSCARAPARTPVPSRVRRQQVRGGAVRHCRLRQPRPVRSHQLHRNQRRRSDSSSRRSPDLARAKSDQQQRRRRRRRRSCSFAARVPALQSSSVVRRCGERRSLPRSRDSVPRRCCRCRGGGGGRRRRSGWRLACCIPSPERCSRH
jgi:hypothetical protein